MEMLRLQGERRHPQTRSVFWMLLMQIQNLIRRPAHTMNFSEINCRCVGEF